MPVPGPWQSPIVAPATPAGARVWPAHVIRNLGTSDLDTGVAPQAGNALYTDGSSHSALWTQWPTASAVGSDLDFEVGGPDYGKHLRAARNRALRTPGTFVDEVQALRTLSVAGEHPAIAAMPEDAVGIEFAGDSPAGVISAGVVEVTFAQQVEALGVSVLPPIGYDFEVRARQGLLVSTELSVSPTRFHYGFIADPSLASWDVVAEAEVDTAGVVSASTSQIAWSDPTEPLNLWVVPTSTSVDPAHNDWLWRPEITSMEFTADVTWPAYRYLFAGGGMWRARQRQDPAGADGWPARQRQNGGASGAWPHRHRQAGR